MPQIQSSILSLLLFLSGAAAAVDYSLPRYQVILDRQPFGAIPVARPKDESVTPQIPVAPPPFIKILRMCAITETSSFGLRVGIVDIKAKPPKSYFFRIGDVQDGIELVDADFIKEGALLKKDGLAYWIFMDGSMGPSEGGGRTPAVTRTAAAGPLSPNPAGTASSRNSYATRLAKRREILEERRRKSMEREEIGPEALKAQLREYQMELIRAGGKLGPPLPIPLTKEMDDKLVAEGVLPPAAAE